MQELTPEQKLLYRNKIITEIYLKGEVHRKIDGICFRNHISKESQIREDVVAETFYHLTKFNTDTLIEMYEDNPARIVGLCVRIACWKGVSSYPKHPGYPNHSVAKNILYASNLNARESNIVVSETDIWDTAQNSLDEGTINSNIVQCVITDSDYEFDPEADLWELIRSELTIEENLFLEEWLNHKKGKGQYKKEYLAKRNNLYNSIKSIIEKHKIIINGTKTIAGESTDGIEDAGTVQQEPDNDIHSKD